MNGTSLLAILRLPFCHLEFFEIFIRRESEWNWNNFSNELKDALSNIIHSSTLRTLYLVGIRKVPITLFLDIVHLTTLDLCSLLPSDFCGEKSSSLTRAASKGVIDRCVWQYWREYDTLVNQSIFMPFMCRLRFFEAYVDLESATMDDFNILSFLMGSLCISLTSPATLEHLELNILFYNYHSDPFIENLRNANVWSLLDSITTHPTGSRLQRVDIGIAYCCPYGDYEDVVEEEEEETDEDEVMKAVLDKLPLLRAKGILFVKASLER